MGEINPMTNTNHINSRYDLFKSLNKDFNPTPQWLADDIRQCFGVEAEMFNPDLRFLARYEYTADFQDYAVVCAKSDDRVKVVGTGLEIIVQSPWNVVKACQQYQIAKGRMIVKDHSPERNRIYPFYSIFRNKWFNEATITQLSEDNETPSGAATYLISFEVYLQQGRNGGNWNAL
jgi:hypothetical protein